jgi:uncharacterized protein DUF6114
VDEDNPPVLAVILSLLGALLIIGSGIAEIAIASAAYSLGFGAQSSLAGLGALGILFGIVLVVLSLALWFKPESHKGIGVAMIVFSFLSILGGAGFILGLVLSLVGGILAVVAQYEEGPGDFPGWTPSSNCANCGRSIGAMDAFCPSCGSPVQRRAW